MSISAFQPPSLCRLPKPNTVRPCLPHRVPPPDSHTFCFKLALPAGHGVFWPGCEFHGIFTLWKFIKLYTCDLCIFHMNVIAQQCLGLFFFFNWLSLSTHPCHWNAFPSPFPLPSWQSYTHPPNLLKCHLLWPPPPPAFQPQTKSTVPFSTLIYMSILHQKAQLVGGEY